MSATFGSNAAVEAGLDVPPPVCSKPAQVFAPSVLASTVMEETKVAWGMGYISPDMLSLEMNASGILVGKDLVLDSFQVRSKIGLPPSAMLRARSKGESEDRDGAPGPMSKGEQQSPPRDREKSSETRDKSPKDERASGLGMVARVVEPVEQNFWPSPHPLNQLMVLFAICCSAFFCC